MEYTIVCEALRHELIKKVNEKLNDGWKLHGNTFSQGSWFYQPMIKEDQNFSSYKSCTKGYKL